MSKITGHKFPFFPILTWISDINLLQFGLLPHKAIAAQTSLFLFQNEHMLKLYISNRFKQTLFFFTDGASEHALSYGLAIPVVPDGFAVPFALHDSAFPLLLGGVAMPFVLL